MINSKREKRILLNEINHLRENLVVVMVVMGHFHEA
jgi:hypothetical protein